MYKFCFDVSHCQCVHAVDCQTERTLVRCVSAISFVEIDLTVGMQQSNQRKRKRKNVKEVFVGKVKWKLRRLPQIRTIYASSFFPFIMLNVRYVWNVLIVSFVSMTHMVHEASYKFLGHSNSQPRHIWHHLKSAVSHTGFSFVRQFAKSDSMVIAKRLLLLLIHFLLSNETKFSHSLALWET